MKRYSEARRAGGPATPGGGTRAPSTRQALAGLALFSRLSEGALDAVARRTVIREVPRERVLFRMGEPCQGLYVVLSGTVRVYRASADGREQVLHTQTAGQPLAEVPLMDGGPYPASARTMEESRLLFLPRADFEWLYLNHSEIADAVIRELGARLRKMVRLVEKISLKDVPARVAVTLLEYAEQAGTLHDGFEFVLPRTQDEVAAELATTRESVARALSRLRREQVIDTRAARVRIRSLTALRKIAAGL